MRVGKLDSETMYTINRNRNIYDCTYVLIYGQCSGGEPLKLNIAKASFKRINEFA